MLSSLYGDLPAAAPDPSVDDKSGMKEDDMFKSTLSQSRTATLPFSDTRSATATTRTPEAPPPAKKIEVNHPALMMMQPRAKKAAPAAVPNASNIALDLMKLRIEKQQREDAAATKKPGAAGSGSSGAAAGGAAQGSGSAPYNPSFSPAAGEPTNLPSVSPHVKEERRPTFMSNIMDEYDPLKPNDYDAICKIKQRERNKEDLERREKEIKQARDHDKIHEEKKSNSFSQKLLKKMGWKEGEGLGKEKQGITAPLIAQKTDAKTARIVQGSELSRPYPLVKPPHVVPAQPPSLNPSIVAAPKQGQNMVFSRPGAPTRVLFLTNLVGKGEVDEDLEEEIREESSKHGTVLKVRIVEANDLPESEAVRIFVLFKDLRQARQAHQKFHGRFFGGRTVQARFFDVARFERDDLMPKPGE